MNINRIKTTIYSLIGLIVTIGLVASCATSPNRSDENRVLIYGMLSSDTSSLKDISRLTFAGVTDEGQRVVYNAMYSNSGIYYLADLKPGRYIATELVFKSSNGSTMTYYLDKKDSFYRTKEAMVRGFDVKPGQLYYVGNLQMSKVAGTKDDPPGTFYFNMKYVKEPAEVDALDKLAKLLKKGPWYDYALEKQSLLSAQ